MSFYGLDVSRYKHGEQISFLTSKEIGIQNGVSESRVCQIMDAVWGRLIEKNAKDADFVRWMANMRKNTIRNAREEILGSVAELLTTQGQFLEKEDVMEIPVLLEQHLKFLVLVWDLLAGDGLQLKWDLLADETGIKRDELTNAVDYLVKNGVLERAGNVAMLGSRQLVFWGHKGNGGRRVAVSDLIAEFGEQYRKKDLPPPPDDSVPVITQNELAALRAMWSLIGDDGLHANDPIFIGDHCEPELDTVSAREAISELLEKGVLEETEDVPPMLKLAESIEKVEFCGKKYVLAKLVENGKAVDSKKEKSAKAEELKSSPPLNPPDKKGEVGDSISVVFCNSALAPLMDAVRSILGAKDVFKTQDVAEKTGRKYNPAAIALAALVEKGVLKKAGRGEWTACKVKVVCKKTGQSWDLGGPTVPAKKSVLDLPIQDAGEIHNRPGSESEKVGTRLSLEESKGTVSSAGEVVSAAEIMKLASRVIVFAGKNVTAEHLNQISALVECARKFV